MSQSQFRSLFKALTGNAPFPWQWELFDRWFSKGTFPKSCNIPTGLGKTSIVAIWLIALARYPLKTPRRLVYVVNRRTVVDQTTEEVEKLRQKLQAEPGLREMRAALEKLCALDLDEGESPLAISTLRGQFADNREWSVDAARPAVIAGTVDMIGSRLLFCGYGLGFKSRPLHAGFLGQDTLLVHDEAHLEPAFQTLITAIANEQLRCNEFKQLQLIELSATPRGNGESFELTKPEKMGQVAEVKKRLQAKKTLRLFPIDDEKKVADHIAQLALEHGSSGAAIVVFLRKLEDVEKVVKKLPIDQSCQLTGTMRGLERDGLARGELPNSKVFMRFLPPSNRASDMSLAEGTVWLVCTSAGEVGINISADHMVCDLVPFDSMTQRLGRVNRFGGGDAQVALVHPTEFSNEPFDERCGKTLKLLKALDGDASPAALGSMPVNERLDAFTPPPRFRLRANPEDSSAWQMLFDAWSLTSVREPMPGRPPIAEYLHGIAEWQLPETYVAWRQEVAILTGDLLDQHAPAEILEDYPLKPHELLRDRSDRVFKHVQRLAQAHPDAPVWLVRDDEVAITSLVEVASGKKSVLDDVTIILPPAVGGLTAGGTLGDENGHVGLDVADEWYLDESRVDRRRIRVFDDDPDLIQKTAGMRLVRSICTSADVNGQLREESEEQAAREWCWYVLPRSADDDGSRTALAKRPLPLAAHNSDVRDTARRIVDALRLDGDLRDAIVFAAAYHDVGKARKLWQLSIGNRGQQLLAKSGNRRPPEIRIDYRHEFGSLLDLHVDEGFKRLSADVQGLVFHLIAAHHGRARPHFDSNEIFDPERSEDAAREAAIKVPRRFIQLQQKYGRWGLAYLESLLRAADAYASANPSEDRP